MSGPAPLHRESVIHAVRLVVQKNRTTDSAAKKAVKSIWDRKPERVAKETKLSSFYHPPVEVQENQSCSADNRQGQETVMPGCHQRQAILHQPHCPKSSVGA